MSTPKKKITGMLPVKKWLSLPEACFFLDMGKDTFLKTALDHSLSVSAVGGKKYYRVDQLENIIEDSIIIK